MLLLIVLALILEIKLKIYFYPLVFDITKCFVPFFKMFNARIYRINYLYAFSYYYWFCYLIMHYFENRIDCDENRFVLAVFVNLFTVQYGLEITVGTY